MSEEPPPPPPAEDAVADVPLEEASSEPTPVDLPPIDPADGPGAVEDKEPAILEPEVSYLSLVNHVE